MLRVRRFGAASATRYNLVPLASHILICRELPGHPKIEVKKTRLVVLQHHTNTEENIQSEFMMDGIISKAVDASTSL